MMLTDAGPLVAILDQDDPAHAACIAVARRIPDPLLTTWACFTEAMYLLGRLGGYRYQSALWRLRASAPVLFHDLTSDEVDRMETLMEKNRDTPMDLADASLIAVAQSRSLRRIFTIDSDFYVYRLADGSALEVIP